MATAVSTRATRAATAPAAPSLGAISIDQIYPLAEFQRLTGLNRWAVRAAAKKGLKVARCGRRKFVSGKAWLDFLADQTEGE